MTCGQDLAFTELASHVEKSPHPFKQISLRRIRCGSVWAMDEHRVGLKPVLRRVWAPRGCRPIARGHHRFE